MDFTVVIPFRNGYETLGRLLDSLPDDLPVVIVDDQSDPPLVVDTGDVERSHVRVVRLERRGYFAGAVNRGMRESAGDVLVLNQDMALEGNAWRSWLAEHRGRHASLGHGQLRHPAWPAGYVQGQFMYLSREAWEQVGEFNARDYPLWGCTAEWQLRAARRGYSAYPVAEVPGVRHAKAEGAAFGAAITQTLEADPARRELYLRTPPLVSVIVTSHSYGRYLADCVASLIGGETSLGAHPGQTLQSFEVIIVDDASADETREVGQALANPWKSIRYVRRNARGGTPAANNTGIQASFGRYITILCADDMRTPESLEALYRVCERDPRVVAYDHLFEFANGSRTLRREMPPYDFDRVVKKNAMHAGIMFPRRAFDETGGYPETMDQGREDWAFNVALGLKGYCGQLVDQPGYLYRREGQNRSLTNVGAEWGQFFAGQMRQLYPALYQGVKPMGCCGGSSVIPASNGDGGGAAARIAAQSDQVGSQGMTLVEYLGGNSATEPWYGPVTGVRYLFGGKRKTGYVDNRDLEKLLAIRQNRRQVFELAEPAAPVLAVPAPALEKEAGLEPAVSAADRFGARHVTLEAGEFEADQIGPVEAIGKPISEPVAPPDGLSYPVLLDDAWVEADPRELTVKQVSDIASKLSAEQRDRMLAMEKEAGAPRKGVVSALEWEPAHA